MGNYLNELYQSNFLQKKRIDNEDIFHILTPCVFRIESNIVHSLKENYKSSEEIGGIFSAKPTLINNEMFFIISNVSYVRNAIEDNPRKDELNISNAYLSDINQLQQERSSIIKQNCLPIEFHTHPTKGFEHFETILNQNYQSETSEQDRRESEFPIHVDGKKLLLPRILIVNNSISSADIFIGVYNGFIAPVGFDTSKNKAMNENINKTIDFFSSIDLTTEQKIGLGLGAALLIFSIIKYPKYSLPVLFGLTATAPQLLTNTQNIEKPEYFNKLSFGNADIYIPKGN